MLLAAAAVAGAVLLLPSSAPRFELAAAPGSSQVRRDWLPQQQSCTSTRSLQIDMVRGEREAAQLVVFVPPSRGPTSPVLVENVTWDVGPLVQTQQPSGEPSSPGVVIPAVDIAAEPLGFTFGGPCPFDSYLQGGCSGDKPWHCALGGASNQTCVASGGHTVQCVGCCGSPARPLRQNVLPFTDPVGWWPYPLLDWVTSFEVQQGAAQPILITVTTRNETIAGLYQANVTVTSGPTGQSEIMPLVVRVHDVVLPRVHDVESGELTLWGTEVSECKGAFANAKHPAKCNDTGMQELLADHRLPAGSGIYHGMWSSNLGNSTEYPDNVGRLRGLWEQGQRSLIVGALTDCQMNASQCQGPKLGLEARLGWMMHAAAQATAAGWPQQNLYIYVMDELGPENIHGVWGPMGITAKAHALLPHAQIVACGDGAFAVAQENGGRELRAGGVLEHVTLLVPRMPTYANTSEAVLEAIRATRKKVGWYTSGIPQGDFALNLFTEYSPIRARLLLGAAAHKYQSDAYLYAMPAAYSHAHCALEYVQNCN